MASKTNNQNRDDGPTSSSIVLHSPYNLRRNQASTGVVSKRSKSVRSKKRISVPVSRTSTTDTQSSSSQNVSNTAQLPSNEDRQLCDSSDTDEMEHSDNEQTPNPVQNTEQTKQKTLSVWNHFEQVDDNIYMCQLCLKVSNYTCEQINYA